MWETAFAASQDGLDRYVAECHGAPVANTPAQIEREGVLLGYPACCAAAFARAPYAPNGLAPADQAILFHWACPGCRETPRLLPPYREVFERIAATADFSPQAAWPSGSAAVSAASSAGSATSPSICIASLNDTPG